MEFVLPPEILIDIFSKLSVRDNLSVSKSCKYWKTIVENYVGEKLWTNLLEGIQESSLNNNTCLVLKHVDISKIDILSSCSRLSNTFFDGSQRLLTFEKFSCDEVLLKTHHSQITIDVCVYKCYIIDKHMSEEESFAQYRTVDNIIKNLKTLLNDGVHYRNLMYSYPLALHTDIKQRLLKSFFEQFYFRFVVLVPRVLMLCEHLDLTDAVVVYSSTHATEVAVVVGGRVAKDRWREVPIGGWRVAEQLHSATKSGNPFINSSVVAFNGALIKRECFLRLDERKRDVSSVQVKLKSFSGCKMFTLKNERYLAAEVMYSELNLASVIHGLLEGLPDDTKSVCLNHILLTGGNCQMKYFDLRLRRDLQRMYPEHASGVVVSVHDGTLCYTRPPALFQSGIQSKFETGRKVALTVEDYIIGNF